MSEGWLTVSVSYTLALSELGYRHIEVMRMTPAYAYSLWCALPDPELSPKPSDDPVGLGGFVL